VGGGFGYKCVLQPEELCVAWLALKFKKPFRWIEDRREHLIAGANCREHHYVVTAYADERGKVLGVDADITVDSGAYSVWPFTSCLESTMAGRHLPGPYAFSGYRARTYSVATNKPPIVPYRGVARTGICFAMELTIDAVARAVGREPCDVRRENLVAGTAMPFVSVTGSTYDSGDYRKSLDIARERVNLPAIRARQQQPEGGDTLIGVGFANYIEMTAHGTALFAAAGYPFAPGHEQAAVRFTPDGGLEVRVGVHSHGQGMETSLAQVAHEVLGIPIAAIAVVHGDTAMTPYSTGTYASRSITMAGGAVARACRTLKARLAAIAAHLLQCTAADVSLRDGVFYGPSGDISVRDVAVAWYMHPQRLPPEVNAGGMEITDGFKPKVDSGQFSYGTHVAVVEIDRALGAVRILDYIIVEDCGTMVNPMIVEGQTLGGAAQGIGTALLEEMRFDTNGQPLASTLADYMLPGATDMPHISVHHIETPSPNTEYGIKGVGEGGAIPPPAAIFNAVNDALQGLGVELNETPLTPHRILAALAEAQARATGSKRSVRS
jgi:carbon-monoxide dehydrogenase large subunit